MKYEVKTARGFTGPRRHRAGVEVATGHPGVFELTKEQVEAIQADDMLVLTKVEAGETTPEGPTKAELQARAKELNVKFNSKTSAAQLTKLIEEAGETTPHNMVDEPADEKEA